LFTGQSGAQYGYDDERTEDGVSFYTREGQEGYMNLNIVVRRKDHSPPHPSNLIGGKHRAGIDELSGNEVLHLGVLLPNPLSGGLLSLSTTKHDAL
jgi:hypothetical protein